MSQQDCAAALKAAGFTPADAAKAAKREEAAVIVKTFLPNAVGGALRIKTIQALQAIRVAETPPDQHKHNNPTSRGDQR